MFITGKHGEQYKGRVLVILFFDMVPLWLCSGASLVAFSFVPTRDHVVLPETRTAT